MKALTIGSALILMLLASGCKKELADCEEHNWGNLRLLNNSSQNVKVYVDDNYFAELVPGDDFEFDHVGAGTHAIHAEQVSSQLSWDKNVVIIQCQRLNVDFTL